MLTKLYGSAVFGVVIGEVKVKVYLNYIVFFGGMALIFGLIFFGKKK